MPVDPRLSVRRRAVRARVALGWLLVGAALLTCTPLHAWTPLLGWGPMLALVASPLLVLLALEPGRPLRMLMPVRRRPRHW